MPPCPSLPELGADDGVVSAFASLPGTPGRIVRVERTHVVHASPAGEAALTVPRSLPDAPCVGDWAAADGGAVAALLPRRSLLGRADVGPATRQQALAANVTHALVAVPLSARVALGRLERMLTLVWSSGASPVVVLTKADVLDADALGAGILAAGARGSGTAPSGARPDLAAVTRAVAAAAPGVEVVACSTVSGLGLPALRALAGPGHTLAVLGASGAGKSSLVNVLAGAPVMATQQVRDDGRGRHTTVQRQLVTLPTGGVVIDTPGLRAVALWAGADEGLEQTFADVEDLAADCRFGDCAHRGEPGCAVALAIAAGVLDARRVESWRKLGRELAWQALKQDARGRRDAALAWRAAHRPTRDPRP